MRSREEALEFARIARTCPPGRLADSRAEKDKIAKHREQCPLCRDTVKLDDHWEKLVRIMAGHVKSKVEGITPELYQAITGRTVLPGEICSLLT